MNKSSSRKSSPRRFSPEGVILLLEMAKAPTSLATPDLCVKIAESIEDIAELKSRMPDFKREEKFWLEIQRTATKLRQLLPSYLARQVRTAVEPTVLGGPAPGDEEAWRQKQFAHLVKTSMLQELLGEVFPKDRPRRSISKIGGWETGALCLYLQYEAMVGKASISRNGPAVRFLVLALKDAGYTSVTKAAVENALARGGVFRLPAREAGRSMPSREGPAAN